MTDERPDPPHDEYPDDWTTFYRDGEPWGRTADGKEFAFDTGSPERVEERCNAPLRDYQRRYGEKRYCTRLPAGNFPGYDSDYCKTHLSMEDLEDRAHELFKHGYFAESYVNVAKRLSPTKFLFAVEMVGGLFNISEYDFEIEQERVTIDTSASILIEDDVVSVELPVPSNDALQFQADQLWQAALSEVEMRKMRELVFKEGVATSTYAGSADVDGQITDTLTEQTEHHLHLPISRVTKDMKEYLKNGGVDLDSEDDAAIKFEQNDYTLDVSPEDDMEPAEAEDSAAVAEDFASKLDAEEETVIEVDD